MLKDKVCIGTLAHALIPIDKRGEAKAKNQPNGESRFLSSLPADEKSFLTPFCFHAWLMRKIFLMLKSCYFCLQFAFV